MIRRTEAPPDVTRADARIGVVTVRYVGEPPMAGSIAAHFHASTDGTRVLNYAEWTDEQAHIDMVTADDPHGVRRRVTGEMPGVRPCGYRRWQPHATLATTRADRVR